MAKTALLIMDLQQGILGQLPDVEAHLPHYASTIAAARSASIQVIYVTINFRPNHPDISPRNKMTAHIGAYGGFIQGDDSVQVHPAIAPADTDILVTKRRVSAFSGSDLELVLRSQGVENLVLTGIVTSGVVLSTLRQASDLDYRVTVLQDLCFDSDPEVHRVLIEKVFPRQADVTTANEWVAGLKKI